MSNAISAFATVKNLRFWALSSSHFTTTSPRIFRGKELQQFVSFYCGTRNLNSVIFIFSIQSYQAGKYTYANLENFPGTTDSKEIKGTWTMQSNKRHWYLGGGGQTCHQACGSHGLMCTANSVSKQTALAPANSVGALAAFKEAGVSCSTIGAWRDYTGIPSAWDISGESFCVGFGQTHDGSLGGHTSSKQSTCDEPHYSSIHRLCYCEMFEYTHAYAMNTRQGCSSSLSDGSALKAMQSCDRSMALLIGPSTSVGTLQDVVSKISDKKQNNVPDYANYMPGECCVSGRLIT